MIQLKYSCVCGKRILAPVTHLHEVKPCPKCQQPLKIPRFGEPSFLLYLCSCGESLEHYASTCPKCQTPVLSTLKPPPLAFRPKIKMKIRCACGKRLLVWAKDTGQPEICPKCQKNFTIPATSAVNVLHFICDCGNYLSLREEICGQCHQSVQQEISTLLTPAVPSTPVIANDSPPSMPPKEISYADSQEIDLTQTPPQENISNLVSENKTIETIENFISEDSV